MRGTGAPASLGSHKTLSPTMRNARSPQGTGGFDAIQTPLVAENSTGRDAPRIIIDQRCADYVLGVYICLRIENTSGLSRWASSIVSLSASADFRPTSRLRRFISA